MSRRLSWYKLKNGGVEVVKNNGNSFYEVILNTEPILFNEGKLIFEENLKNNESFKAEVVNLAKDVFLISKEGWKILIECYRKHISNILYELTDEFECQEYVRQKQCMWSGDVLSQGKYYPDRNFEIDLTDNPYKVSKSSEFEYTIFNLIHVYKTFDWENYTMVGHIS